MSWQEEQVQVVDKTKEMNERLLVEVRRRLQAARSQLNSAPPSEADAGTPVDSPMGGRPRVLQNRTSEGVKPCTPCLLASFRPLLFCMHTQFAVTPICFACQVV